MQTDPEDGGAGRAPRRMRIVELRALYRRTFRSDPPKAYGPDLLRRSIAHRIQEKALAVSTGRPVACCEALSLNMPRIGKLALPRRIKPGAMLVRKWKGERHR